MMCSMKNFILLVALFLVAPFAQGSSPQHLLVSGGKVVGEDVITQDTFWAGVFIQVFLPCSLPVPAFGVIAGITEAQQTG